MCRVPTGAVACMVVAVLAGLHDDWSHAQTSRRQECLAACAVRIAACTTTCNEFGDLGAGCRRAVLRRCRLEGPSTCAGPTTTSTTIPPTGEGCADAVPLAVSPTLDGSTTGDTRGAADDLGASCIASSGGRDRVFAVTNPRATEVGFLTAGVITSGFDAVLSIRSSCPELSAERACSNSGGPGATEIASAPMPPSATFYLMVDGAGPVQAGTFILTFSFE
jgi:hypothetical protein